MNDKVSMDLVIPQEDNIFASIVDGPDSESTSEGENSDSAAVSAEGSETEEVTPGEESSSDDDLFSQNKELEEPLFEEESSEEGDGKGETPFHQHPRFKKLVKQKNELKEEVSRIKEEADSTKEQFDKFKEGARSFYELYKDFQDPLKQVQADHEFASMVEDMYQKGVPEARALVQKMQNGGYSMSDKTNDLFTSQKDNKGDQQGDPRVEKLLRRQMSSQVNDFLKNTSIKPEYHKVLRNHVVNTVDPSEDISEDEIKGAIKEFISDNGWTKEMLVGSESQSQTPKPPAGKPSAANTKTRSSRKSDSSEDNSEDEINDPDEFKNMLRSEIMNAL